MPSTPTGRRRARRALALLPAVLACLLAPTGAAAQSCWLGFMNGTAPTIDGQPGGQWGDAATLADGTGCLDAFHDWDGVSVGAGNIPTLTGRTLRISSKRNASNLFLLFEVEDHTRLQTDATELSLGEMIIIHVDPNFSRTADLENGGTAITRDYRIEIINKRGVAPLVVRSAASTSTQLCGAVTRNAFAAPAVNAAIEAQAVNSANSYTVEVRIPLSQVGSPAAGANLGLAVAVVNDLGSNNFATGTAFPAGMPLNDVMYGLLTNPANPGSDCNQWISPVAWGGGFGTSAPSTVTISRSPVYWNSEDVAPMACSTPSYTYYAGKPCKLRLRATLRNSGTATLRNVLFLFGNRDAAQVKWTTVGLLKDVAVPAGNTQHLSALFSPPTGLAEHPCVRVLILPTTFHATIGEAFLTGLNNAPASTFDDIVAAYGLADPQWAQKNISRWSDPSATCPVAGCAVSFDPRERSFPGGAPVLASLSEAAAMLAMRPAHAQEPTPHEDTTRARIFLSDEEWRLFGRTDAVVQAATYGVTTGSAYSRPTYKFIEPLGGAIQLLPVEELRERGNIPVTFQVTNPDDADRTVIVDLATFVPPGSGVNVQAQMREPLRLKAGETGRVAVTAGFGKETGGKIDTDDCPLGVGGSVLALAGLALLGLGRRSRGRS